jgi:predicted methyltransferase
MRGYQGDRYASNGRSYNGAGYDRVHFAIIRIVHENLYGLLVNPYGRLTRAGLKRGQRVIEVGCGPGFFTVPAAKIVGEAGYVYALDINAAAGTCETQNRARGADECRSQTCGRM